MAATDSNTFPDVRVDVPLGAIEEFCRRYQVLEFALFGSVLRSDFRPDSDIDVLVRFEQTARPTLLTLARMEQELERVFQRPVDLVERRGIEQSTNAYIRVPILSSARVIYAR